MKKLLMSSMMILAMLNNAHGSPQSLQEERFQVVQNYMTNLKTGDASNMSSLFEEEATVVSTSKGKMPAIEFFNSFLPDIKSAKLTVKRIFISPINKDHLAARFHYQFELSNGDTGDAEYMDDFQFSKNTDKLIEVVMFENRKF